MPSVSKSSFFRKSSNVVMPLAINSFAFFGPIPYTRVSTLSGLVRSRSNIANVPVSTYSFSFVIIVLPMRFVPSNCLGSVISPSYIIIASAASRYAFARNGSPWRIIISWSSLIIFVNSSFKRFSFVCEATIFLATNFSLPWRFIVLLCVLFLVDFNINFFRIVLWCTFFGALFSVEEKGSQ